MDLYIIKTDNKIKVGKTYDFTQRKRNIITAAGLIESEIFHQLFPAMGDWESFILYRLKDEKINGEWFYYRGIAKEFFDFFYSSDLTRASLYDFFESYYLKQERKDSEKINKILLDILFSGTKKNLERTFPGHYTIEAGVNEISDNFIKILSRAELLNLFDDNLNFLVRNNFYSWNFPYQELGLVKELLKIKNIEYHKL